MTHNRGQMLPADISFWRSDRVQNHAWVIQVVKDKAGDTLYFSSCQQKPTKKTKIISYELILLTSIVSDLFWLNQTLKQE